MSDWPQNVARSDRKNKLWAPSGAIDETTQFGRFGTMGGNSMLGTGRINVVGGIVLMPGDVVTNITFASGSTGAATCTHCWFALIRQSDLAVLAKTTDDTAASPWAINTFKTLALASPYSNTVEQAVLLGVVVVGTTMPNLLSANTIVTYSGAPIFTATSTTGLTDPASLGANAGALTAVANLPYAYIS